MKFLVTILLVLTSSFTMADNIQQTNKALVEDCLRKFEINRIEQSFIVYNVPKQYQEIILDAIESDDWDWYIDCDGCTFVSDLWPSKFNPACLVHDWLWVTGRGGRVSDKIFLELQLIYKIPKHTAYLRYMGVRLGWVFWYKWKHMIKGEVKPIEEKYKLLTNRSI